jgi:hypothetical protein
MRILFDVSGTVLGMADMTPRPGIRETIETLRNFGNAVDFWTGGPTSEYSFILSQLGIDGTVYSKNNPLPFVPDICVDDDPIEFLPCKVVVVPKYIGGSSPHMEIKASALLSTSDLGK